ncbi:MAG: hypothetical protein QME81_20365, partial [bacterium]|nr:hypothetical protein [bacterium]
KNLLIEDYAEARSSLQSRNYKATIVLCGSLIEAVLVDILKQKEIPTQKAYNQLTLNDAINTIKSHKLIKNQALLSLFDPLRKYRNMIHPGVSDREGILPDPSIAHIALETVNLLIKELNQNS